MRPLFLLLLALWSLTAPAQVPPRATPPAGLTYQAPLTITQGGTYSGGAYQSQSSAQAVITIKTDQPVVLENMVLVGPWILIRSDYGNHVSLTVRNVRGYGTTPTADNVNQGEFLYCYYPQSLTAEHNYFECTRGISVDGWWGNGPGPRIRYNKDLNGLAGTRQNSDLGANAVLLNAVLSVPGIEVAWNQSIAQPGLSRMEDVYDFSNTSGTATSHALIHDNYAQGAYPYPATSSNFNGTGLNVDGDAKSRQTGQVGPAFASAYLDIYNNQLISTGNAGLNVAAGHDINVTGNRVVTSGTLAGTSTLLGKAYCGLTAFNAYNTPFPAYGNITITGNSVAYNNTYGKVNGRFDYGNLSADRAGFNQQYGISLSGNLSPAAPTVAGEAAEWGYWQAKLAAAGITVGPLTVSTTDAGNAGLYGPAAVPVLVPGAKYQAGDVGPGSPAGSDLDQLRWLNSKLPK